MGVERDARASGSRWNRDRIKSWLRSQRTYWTLPAAARKAHREDRRGIPDREASPSHVIEGAVGWLARAQDRSASCDGGVARHFSLKESGQGGWAPSYPETTGYIIPTLLSYSAAADQEDAKVRARRMLDWLVSIQLRGGGFPGGMIGQEPIVPVTFNTGQILLGLAAGEKEFGAYGESMRRAADFLLETQGKDGCWRRNPSPFARKGEKTYDTHVAWALFEAARLEPDRPYGSAGLANVDWALSLRLPNGWFSQCCLNNPNAPLTHTIGYALRGVLEAYRWSRKERYLEAALVTARGVLGSLGPDGWLPGRLDADWREAASWCCLTGSAQVAICWMILYQETGDAAFLEAARSVNALLCRTVDLEGPDGVRGGVKGSFPISGGYGTYEYLNWACKFLVDSLMLEEIITSPSGTSP